MAIDSIDYGTDKISTHSFTENAVEKHTERIAPGCGVAGAWDVTASVSAVGLVGSFSLPATGRGRIIIGAKCETTADYFYSAFLVFKSSTGVTLGVSATFSPTFKLHSDGGTPAKKYATVQAFANECGASTVEMYVTALPVGATSLDLYMAAL